MTGKRTTTETSWPTGWRRVSLVGILGVLLFASGAQGSGLVPITNPVVYADGRPYPSYRMDATDLGKFLDYGNAPNGTDYLGAREALINQVDGKYYIFYDGAGPDGWLAHLAESTDLVTWNLKGPVLDFGAPGSADSAAACSPWIVKDDDDLWHMFYLGTPNATGAPNYVPSFPYLTLRATATSPAGPWTKQYSPVPFTTQPGTYYSATASPGHVVQQGDEYLMFFSSTNSGGKRTIGIARTQDLAAAWTMDSNPALPVTEQIENSSLYYQESDQTWFLFTNHVGLNGGEYTDGIWVYWTTDINSWDPANKAVVLDGANCTWSSVCIGMPSVTVVGDKLYIFYDAPGGTSASHMRRSLGMATLDLPLDVTIIDPADLNRDGESDVLDWIILRDNGLTDMSGLTLEAAALLGDLDGDRDNDIDDFVLFKKAYEAENPAAGAFEAMVASAAIPEPASILLLAAGLAGFGMRRGRIRHAR